jgi:prephenate dehydrogenase
MTTDELTLLHSLRAAVKKNPELFSQAVMYMQDGVTQAIAEAKEHAMQMEKLAFAFHASNSKKHTAETKAWVDRMVVSVKDTMKYFPLGD